MIRNPARLSLQRRQLLIGTDDGDATLPLEDLNALLLESPRVTLTSSLLAACQEHDVCVITCDAAHMPNGVLLPFQPHSRQGKVARIQLSWSEPLRKRLWQRVVQTKITNQADCLARTGSEEAGHRLRILAGQVTSGDVGNLEAQAARAYWPHLFGPDFRRSGNDSINAALNYGYAVVRAFVARSQVAHGLIPTFGLHHDNELNAFNLTDDMMEVFRPLVDETVKDLHQRGLVSPETPDLTADVRQELANSGNTRCLIEGKIQTLSTACDRLAAGLVAAIEARSPAVLPLPSFRPAGDSGDTAE